MAEENYTGWKRWEVTAEEWNNFYNTQQVPFEMLENEYLILCPEGEHPLYYCYEQGEFRQFHGGSIKTFKEKDNVSDSNDTTTATGKKKKTAKFSKGKQVMLYPRNDEQVCAFDLLKDRTKTIKLVTGTWGTGKTCILVNAALEALKEEEFEQIVWIRNNVAVRDTAELGLLPGTALEKLAPYLGPFVDHAGEAAVATMINKESLKVEPLQSLRGRDFKNTIIICSEAENLTKEHLQLIIARAAEGTEVWFDGDTRQRDRVAFEKSKGLETMIDQFKGKPLFGYVHLVKSERSATAAMADLLN